MIRPALRNVIPIQKMDDMMKRLLLSALCTLTFSSAFANDELPGFDEITVKTTHRTRPVAGSIWYPVGTKTYKGLRGDNPVFVGNYAYVGAGVKEGKFPLILFSHGSGGNMFSAGWLFSALAKKGAMVVAVNHPGSTSGDSSPRRSILLDERAKDLSATLDTILNDPNFNRYIDQSQIIAAGFSMGGASVLNLAGARWDREKFSQYCKTYKSADPGCIFFSKGGVDFDHLPDGFIGNAKDERVTKVVSIDPGYTVAFDKASAKDIQIPVQFINIGHQDRTFGADLEAEGNNILSLIPDASYAVTDHGDHFAFLPSCKPEGTALLEADNDDPVCTDPEGTDRVEVHEQIQQYMEKFIGLD
ncbi:Alpha/beta hydrolase family protein [Pseudovibrio sp. Ad37]|nr:Alpha/beta hydrolase family protein [Pseudovibrio sp. Ad37]